MHPPSQRNVQALVTLPGIRSISFAILLSSLFALGYMFWDTEALREDTVAEDDYALGDDDAANAGLPNNRDMYLPFDPSAYSQHHDASPLLPKTPVSCLEGILDTGEVACETWASPSSIDIVWSWVNSTDHVWRFAHDTIEHKVKGLKTDTRVDYKNAISHFRDFDELRYSMRSMLHHFRPYVHRFHLLASDFDVPDDFRDQYNLTEDLRLGQLPQWLSPSPEDWRDDSVQLSVHHHGAFFQDYSDSIFSSFTIESQLRHLRGVSDIFIYLNDDMYFLKDLTPADFYTPAYGFVFRIDMYMHVPPELEARPQRGEWQPLRETNILLSRRFGLATRPYVVHMAKVMSLPHLNELAASFPQAFDRTGARFFREVWLNEPGDVHTPFMLAQFVVERWREALLWTWAIGRLGGDDDSWDARAAWDALGFPSESSIRVEWIRRDTLNEDRVQESLAHAGHSPPGGTHWFFASGDGYPFYLARHGQAGHPNLDSPGVCTIRRDECFPHGITTASDGFQHIAFAKPQCGDCLISLLVQQSGKLGLSAFLPPADRWFTPGADGPTPETLPLVPEWEQGEFALADVLRRAPREFESINVREWTLRLLDRYRFVLGEAPNEFTFMTGPASVKDALRRIESRPDLALACFNDDVVGDGGQVAELMHGFYEMRWPEKAQWEYQ